MHDLALADELADPGGRDALAVGGHERHRRDAEAELLAERDERVGIALRGVAEAVVLADDDVHGARLGDQHLLGEGLRREQRELVGERDHEQLVDALLRDQLGAAVDAREPARDLARAQDLGRHRLERRDRAGRAELLRALQRLVDQPPVPQVDAVERAERDHARARLELARALRRSSLPRPPRRASVALAPAARRRTPAGRPTGSAPAPPRRAPRSRGRAAARRARQAPARAPAGAPARRCTTCASRRRADRRRRRPGCPRARSAGARSPAAAAPRSRRRSRAPRRDRAPARARRCPSSSGRRVRRGRSRASYSTTSSA